VKTFKTFFPYKHNYNVTIGLLNFFHEFKVPIAAKIIDIGGGDSFLVDHLLDLGYEDITVLDISSSALERAKERLGNRANNVKWIVAGTLGLITTPIVLVLSLNYGIKLYYRYWRWDRMNPMLYYRWEATMEECEYDWVVGMAARTKWLETIWRADYKGVCSSMFRILGKQWWNISEGLRNGASFFPSVFGKFLFKSRSSPEELGMNRIPADSPVPFALGKRISFPRSGSQCLICPAAREPAGSFPCMPPTTIMTGPAFPLSETYQDVSCGVPLRNNPS
jgi:SAM-dependent methyltransferase